MRRDIDLDLTLDMLGAPLMYRRLVTGEPVDEETGTRVGGPLLEGITSRPQS